MFNVMWANTSAKMLERHWQHPNTKLHKAFIYSWTGFTMDNAKKQKSVWLKRQLLCLTGFRSHWRDYSHYGRLLKSALVLWFRARMIIYEMMRALCPCLASTWESSKGTQTHTHHWALSNIQAAAMATCLHPRGTLYRATNINMHTQHTRWYTRGTPLLWSPGIKHSQWVYELILCQKVCFMAS